MMANLLPLTPVDNIDLDFYDGSDLFANSVFTTDAGQSFIGVHARFDAIIDKLQKAEKGLSTLVGELNTNLERINTELTADTAIISSLQTDVESLKGNVTSLLSRATASESAIAALEGTVAAINVSINAINGDIASFNERLGEQEAMLNSVNDMVADMFSDMRSLPNMSYAGTYDTLADLPPVTGALIGENAVALETNYPADASAYIGAKLYTLTISAQNNAEWQLREGAECLGVYEHVADAPAPTEMNRFILVGDLPISFGGGEGISTGATWPYDIYWTQYNADEDIYVYQDTSNEQANYGVYKSLLPKAAGVENWVYFVKFEYSATSSSGLPSTGVRQGSRGLVTGNNTFYYYIVNAWEYAGSALEGKTGTPRAYLFTGGEYVPFYIDETPKASTTSGGWLSAEDYTRFNAGGGGGGGIPEAPSDGLPYTRKNGAWSTGVYINTSNTGWTHYIYPDNSARSVFAGTVTTSASWAATGALWYNVASPPHPRNNGLPSNLANNMMLVSAAPIGSSGSNLFLVPNVSSGGAWSISFYNTLNPTGSTSMAVSCVWESRPS